MPSAGPLTGSGGLPSTRGGGSTPSASVSPARRRPQQLPLDAVASSTPGGRRAGVDGGSVEKSAGVVDPPSAYSDRRRRKSEDSSVLVTPSKGPLYRNHVTRDGGAGASHEGTPGGRPPLPGVSVAARERLRSDASANFQGGSGGAAGPQAGTSTFSSPERRRRRGSSSYYSPL